MKSNIRFGWIGIVLLCFTPIMSSCFAEEAPAPEMPVRVEYTRILSEMSRSEKVRPDSLNEQVERAKKLFELGDFMQASEIIERLLNASENEPGPMSDVLFLSASIAYLTGDYDQAEKRYKALLEIPNGPLNIEARVGLLYTYFQTDKFHKAVDLFSGIAENGAERMGRSTQSAIAMWKMMRCFAENEPYRINWRDSGDHAVVRFVSTNPLPVIEAEVNGRKVNLVLDTGGGLLILDSSIATGLGISEIAKSEGVYAGGKTSEFCYGKLDTLSLADVSLSSVPVEITPLQWSSTDSNTSEEFKIDGIIGTDILRHFLTTVDYPGQQLVLRPRHASQNSELLADSAEFRKIERMPFFLASTHLMLVKGAINSRQDLTIFLDSGLNHPDAAVLLPIWTLDYTGIPIPQTDTIVDGNDMVLAGGFSMGSFPIKSVRLGKLEQMDLIGLYGVFPPELYFGGLFDNTAPFFVDALVSHNFLKQYKWIIDFDSMTMLFCH